MNSAKNCVQNAQCFGGGGRNDVIQPKWWSVLGYLIISLKVLWWQIPRPKSDKIFWKSINSAVLGEKMMSEWWKVLGKNWFQITLLSIIKNFHHGFLGRGFHVIVEWKAETCKRMPKMLFWGSRWRHRAKMVINFGENIFLK